MRSEVSVGGAPRILGVTAAYMEKREPQGSRF